MKHKVVLVRLSGKCSGDIFPAENRPPFDLLQTHELLKIKHNIPSLLIDEQIKPQPLPALVKECLFHRPKIVVLSCLSIKIFECKNFFKTVKKLAPETICIAVGHLATYCTRQICYPDSYVDFVIRGECQIILGDFIGCLLKSDYKTLDEYTSGAVFSKISKELSNLHIIENVNELPVIPFKKKSLRHYSNLIPIPLAKNITWGRVFSSYGCPNTCIFCTQTIRDTYGRNHRLRSVSLVIEEIKQLKRTGANIIEFADDNFTASRGHLLSLCHGIIESKIKIPWGAHVRVDNITYDTFLLMKRAGCLFIRCGIESGSEPIIDSLKKIAYPETWKQQARKVFYWAKEFNIITDANVILGNPGESENDMKKTKELIFELSPDILQVHSFCAYPGADAYATICKEPSDHDLATMHHHNNFKFCKEPLAAKKIQEEILREFFLRISYIYKSIVKFGPYYILNPEKTLPIVRSLLKIAYSNKSKNI